MSKVLSHMTMSLDGFIAQPDDGIGELFEWYEAGDVHVDNASDDIRFSVDEASAVELDTLVRGTGLVSKGPSPARRRSVRTRSSSRVALRVVGPGRTHTTPSKRTGKAADASTWIWTTGLPR